MTMYQKIDFGVSSDKYSTGQSSLKIYDKIRLSLIHATYKP